MAHKIATARRVPAAFGVFWNSPTGQFVPCEAYTIDANGNTTSGDDTQDGDLADAYSRGATFLTYEGFVSPEQAEARAIECGNRYSVVPLPAGWCFYDGEQLCVVAPSEPTSPADYARDHWRKFEHPQDHAERVEAAEREAGRYFASVTKRQLQAFNDTMAALRQFRGPAWDRRRNAARAAWDETTAGARHLFEITADEIMRDGEVSEATALAWDVLAEVADQAAPPAPVLSVVTTTHP